MKDIDDTIDQFIEDLDFDNVIKLANFIDVSWEYPPTDDMWPDWENELRVEVGDELRKVFE